jgi:PAS domain S-box-containing protein
MSGRQNPPPAPAAADLDFLSGGGEMGALMRAHDWTGSPLGPPAAWPQSLRTVVRLMLNTGHPMYIWWGADLACLYNDAYRESIGPERHPGSLGQPALEVWAEIWPIIGPQIDQVLSGGGATWQVNHLVPITRHGRREDVYWTYSYSPIDDRTAPGGIGGILVVCTETTEQILAARRLAIERDQLSQLFEQAPTFMAMLRGPEHRFELANPSYMTLVGHRPVLGRTIAEALPDAVEQGYLALLDEVFASGTAYVARGAKYAAQAEPHGPVSERYVDFVYQPIKDAEGRVSGIFVEGADVTDRMLADAALQVLEPRLHGLLETIPGFIWTADAGGEIDYISPRLSAFVGRDEARFKRAFWPEFIHPDDLPRMLEVWQRVNARRASFQVDVRFRRNDGAWRWLDIRAEPELQADGRILRWFGYGEDQHEQKEVADALQASEVRFREIAAQLSNASRLKDEFLATLAHELRNPLAPLRNALDLLKIAPADGRTAALARETMERQLAQMVRLIDDLLDLSRVSRGMVELRPTRLALGGALRDALETSRPVIEERGHEVAVTLPDEELEVEADPTRIVQVVANLLNNAAKFTPRGGRIALTLAREDGERAVVAVRDNGIGIPAGMLGGVFDMFTQVDRSHAHVGGGLGIGLTIAQRLVEMHGGSIEAHSGGPGAGSEFRVHLPLAALPPLRPPAAPCAAHVLAPAEGGAGLHPEPRAPRRRILVADDNVDAAESLSMLLSLLGHETRTAHDGEQAFALARDFRPDVMVLDVAMPRLSGHEVARRVRAEDWGKTVLLIAASGWGQEVDKRRSLEAGFDCHLVKPVESATLEKLLAKERPQGEPAQAPARLKW